MRIFTVLGRRIQKATQAAFGISQTEANGFLILFALLSIVLCIQSIPPNAYPFFEGRTTPHDTLLLQDLVLRLENNYCPAQPNDVGQAPKKRFAFNPNTASKAVLVQLGLRDYLANRVVKYRNNGGVFRTKKDFAKIYGLDSSLYRQLYDYIDLPRQASRQAPTNWQKKRYTAKRPTQKAYRPKTKHLVRIDLNQADTAQLKAFKGIGRVLARRIVSYRKKLGGYVSPDQLADVYGLRAEVIAGIQAYLYVSDGFAPVRIDINTASASHLAAHPYISKKVARVMVAYRYQHGPFRQIEDLKRIAVLDEGDYAKMRPYLYLGAAQPDLGNE